MSIYKNLLNFVRSYNGPYSKCPVCGNYEHFSDWAYLDSSGVFCLHCAKTEDFIRLRCYLDEKFGNFLRWFWTPDKIMRKKYIN